MPRGATSNRPGAAAGVRPGHRYISINNTPLLGKTIPQIGQLLKDYPKTPLTLREQGGALQSPAPLNALHTFLITHLIVFQSQKLLCSCLKIRTEKMKIPTLPKE